MPKRFRPLLSFVLLSLNAIGQQVRPAASAEIYHKLLQLNKLVNVLYFAAHPDDENTRLLSWLVHDQNVRTAYLSLTRGDGGQNILGREQSAALGLIRTYELLEARKIDGAEQFFTRAVDFGFSKNHNETFKHWNQSVLTGDAVWTIRSFRPDIIICRFPPDARAGHGQHAASAIVAAEAFKAAGDKKRYPEQLKYSTPWQPKRLLLNTYRFGTNNTLSESQFKLATGQYKPQLGMGYSELAGISRSVHRSQGAGTPSVAGIQSEYFLLTDGEAMSSTLFDGIDITWNRVGRKDIGGQIENVIKNFNYSRPDLSLPDLLRIKKQIKEVKDPFWRKEKLKEIDQLILDCSGLMTELYCNQPEAVAGSDLSFSFNSIARSEVAVQLESLQWQGGTAQLNRRLANDSLFSANYKIKIPEGTPVSEPYWLSRPGKDAFHYDLPADTLNGIPASEANPGAVLKLKIGGEPFMVRIPLSYKRLDPVKGDLAEALRIVPPVITGFTGALLIRDEKGDLNGSVRLHAMKDINGELSLIADTRPVFNQDNISLRTGQDTVIQFHLKTKQMTAAGTSGDGFTLKAVFQSGDFRFDRLQHLIRYDHIPTLQYFTPSDAKVLNQNWKCSARKIGYIEGAGDFTADFLRLAGLDVVVLKDENFISAAGLEQFDAIITGIRAVNTEKKMAYWLPVLHQYVKNGGTLVMQYNTLQDLAAGNIGPYPFSLANLRVTEEDAKVEFTDPSHRLLNYPNKITESDFRGWVQERGLYFPSQWDDRYETLFSMHDEDEQPLKGSTLYTRYGKGHYIYSSLSFFRQLPAGNTGAVRLLMNMLSAGK